MSIITFTAKAQAAGNGSRAVISKELDKIELAAIGGITKLPAIDLQNPVFALGDLNLDRTWRAEQLLLEVITLKNAVKYRIQKLKHHWFTKTTHIVNCKSLGTLKTDIATQQYKQIACCDLYATTYKADVYLNYVDGSVFCHSFFNQFFARPEIRFSLNPKESQLTLGIGSTIESLERRYFFTSLVYSSPYISFNLNYKIDAFA